jgi:hypothetical protein
LDAVQLNPQDPVAIGAWIDELSAIDAEARQALSLEARQGLRQEQSRRLLDGWIGFGNRSKRHAPMALRRRKSVFYHDPIVILLEGRNYKTT